jgi:hypothetical protein
MFREKKGEEMPATTLDGYTSYKNDVGTKKDGPPACGMFWRRCCDILGLTHEPRD